MEDTKITRQRLRRAAARQCLQLRKSHRRDPRALDYGRFWLTNLETGIVVLGGQYGVTIDAAARYLGEDVTA